MKKSLILFCLCALMGAGFMACDDGKPQEEPQDIPFVAYDLNGGTRQWVRPDDNRVLIINSDEEMGSLFPEVPSEYYPVVDFAKKTLIMAFGPTTKGVSKVDIDSFKEVSGSLFRLDVSVSLTLADVAEGWHIAFIVDKISEHSEIELNANITY